MSWFLLPPVTSTLSSGNTVICRNARGFFIDATCCTCGFAAVMSNTYALALDVCDAVPGPPEVPARKILPGWYITADPASVTLPSTVDHVQLLGLRIWTSVGFVNDPTWTIRPSGSTNMNGYSGM